MRAVIPLRKAWGWARMLDPNRCRAGLIERIYCLSIVCVVSNRHAVANLYILSSKLNYNLFSVMREMRGKTRIDITHISVGSDFSYRECISRTMLCHQLESYLIRYISWKFNGFCRGNFHHTKPNCVTITAHGHVITGPGWSRDTFTRDSSEKASDFWPSGPGSFALEKWP